MLTKDDLKNIKSIVNEVVREEIEVESQTTRDEIQSEMKLMRMRIEDRLHNVKDAVKNHTIKLNRVEKEIKELRKDVSVIISSFNRDNVRLAKRID